MSENKRRPLEGLRVIDFTRAMAGPYATMLLADMGATVVKIESPRGDMTRRLGPRDEGVSNRGYGGYFQSVNRGKESIVVDLWKGDEKDLIQGLIRESDILVENYRPGIMEKLNLDYESLKSKFPRLIYGSLTGFGNKDSGDTPWMHKPAFDLVVQALGGVASITGYEKEPVKVGPGIGDIFPGALLCAGILAAVHERNRSGKGQLVDVAMYDSMVSLCERIIYQYSYEGVSPVGGGRGHPLMCPFDYVKCKDGWVAIAAGSDRMWSMLCKKIGREDLSNDETLNRHDGRVEQRERVIRIIEEWSAKRTKAEVEKILQPEIPCGAVADAEDISKSEQAKARNMLVHLENPETGRQVTVAGTPIKFSRTTAYVKKRAPLLDEDGEKWRRAVRGR